MIFSANQTHASGWKKSRQKHVIDTYLCYKAIYTYEFVARDNKTNKKQ
jgi:hypothetical protein